MQRTPNTVQAHRLIQAAQDQGRAAAVVDALFRAYFEQGEDIGDAAVLDAIAGRCAVEGWPQAADGRRVETLEGEVRSMGISAVPTFILERRLGVSGAQPPEALAAALREAAGA
jgi:predicted DsbA family dithiol-disulfide isomerase